MATSWGTFDPERRHREPSRAGTGQKDSGLLQTLVMRSQKDPTEVFVVVVFESEEKARAREQDPRRQEPLQRIRAAMGDVLSGPPEFFDCNVLLDA
jgi:heme-degrading monooxygenase HmoA